MGKPVDISIANRDSDIEALAALFVGGLSPDYISHQELQSYRTLGLGQWAPDIREQFREEIRPRLNDPRGSFPASGDWVGVVEAHADHRLVGVALVTISRQAAVPFGIIEDIVVDQTVRDKGYGAGMMNWIADRLRAAGIKRAFLESGVGNEQAHHLFERLGFKQVSMVMMLEL
jgi:GNAT superfamily N-acetyltransferase